MSREILFRAKRKGIIDGNFYRSEYKNGDWVYGLITKQYSKEFWDKLNDEMRDIYGVSGIEIDRDTVGQFTGIHDKFGKKIFEGDILRGFDYPFRDAEDNYNYYAEVIWIKNSPAFGFVTHKNPESNVVGISDGDCNYIQAWDNHRWEIIGNIYDNPELLEK